jgi:hypothetical protein
MRWGPSIRAKGGGIEKRSPSLVRTKRSPNSHTPPPRQRQLRPLPGTPDRTPRCVGRPAVRSIKLEKTDRMYRVIDTIDQRSEWLRHHPHLPQKEGVLAVLDPTQVDARLQKGVRVRINRPNGTSISLQITEARYNAQNVVALFFCEISSSEIPRGSLIEPLE